MVLTWKRTSSDFYDTLVDDAHVYTYGLELTKLFSDGKGDFSKVEFLIHNDTDNYFVKAELNEAQGIYYVVDHVEAEADATHFIPSPPAARMVKSSSRVWKMILHHYGGSYRQRLHPAEG